jgi:[acyl-carrier-protein] S-malonyltransferase
MCASFSPASDNPDDKGALHMGGTAFVFPGQGSQRVGMGAELRDARPDLFDHYFSLADEASGLAVRSIALEGPMEELTRTDVAQPALFGLSLAVADAARELGLAPDFVAGHSLGEYTAAVAAGALGVEDGMRLVARRGRLMADIQSHSPGAMAALIGLDRAAVEQLCAEAAEAGVVAPANVNTPEQIVVSGEEAGVQRVVELAPGAGAKKAVRLRVGAAFHSRMMEPVQAELAQAMESIDWSDPHVPLASNASGTLVTTGEQVRQALIDQIASPVLWVDCVTALLANGCQTFLELGPGRVLGKLVTQIDGDAEVFAADSPEKLSVFAARG